MITSAKELFDELYNYVGSGISFLLDDVMLKDLRGRTWDIESAEFSSRNVILRLRLRDTDENEYICQHLLIGPTNWDSNNGYELVRKEA